MAKVSLIYYPLIKGEFRRNEKLNLKELSDSLKTFDGGLNLMKNDFSHIGIQHGFGTANYTGGGPALDMEKVLQYRIKFLGDENSLKKAVSSYLDFCGLPHAVGGNSKILEDYFDNKGKKLYGDFLYFLEPHKRKLVKDKS